MTNREITFIVRLRNEARQAIQGLIGDLTGAGRGASSANTSGRSFQQTLRQMATDAQGAARNLNQAVSSMDATTGATQRATAASRARATALESEAAAQARIAATVARGVDRASAGVPQAVGGRVGSTIAREASGAAGIANEARTAERAVEELESVSTSRMGKFKASMLSAFDTSRDALAHFRGNLQAWDAKNVVKVGEDVEKAGEKVAGIAPKLRLGSGAMRELVVMAREGARGDFSRMAGSMSLFLTQVGLFNVMLPVAAVALGGLFLAHKQFNSEAEKDSLKKYAESLGLTSKEMRKLQDETVGAGGKLKEFSALQITYMDELKGLWDTIIANPEIQAAWQYVWGEVKSALTDIAKETAQAVGFIVGAFVGAYHGVLDTWKLWPGALGDLIMQGVNYCIDGVNNLIKAGVDGLNGFIDKANGVLGAIHLPTLDHVANVQIPEVENQWKGMSARTGQIFSNDMKKSINGVKKWGDDLMSEWGKNSDMEARKRIAKSADAIKAHRTPKKERTHKPKVDHEPSEEAKFWADLLGQDAASGLNEVMASATKDAQKLLDIRNKGKSVNLATLDDLKKTADWQKIIGVEMDKHTKALTDQLRLANESSEADYAAKLKTLGLSERDLAVQEAIIKAKANAHKAGIDDPSNAKYGEYLQQVARAGQDAGKSWDMGNGAKSIEQLASTYAGYSQQLQANLTLQKQLRDIETLRTTDGAAYDAILKSMGLSQAQFNAVLAQANDHLRANADWMSAGKSAAEDYINDIQTNGMKMGKVWTDAFKGMEDALVNFITTGKLNFKGMVDSMIADIARLLVEKEMEKAVGSLFGIPVGHSGGIVGGGGDGGRAISPAVFAGAKRFHVGGLVGNNSGLQSREVPVIAKENEAIFPTVRTPDGNFGIKAILPDGGMGGGKHINFAPVLNISVDGGGDPKDHAALAGNISQQTVKSLEALVKRVLGDEMRSGGMLSGA